MLKQQLLEALKPREERLEVLGTPVVVREIAENQDTSAFADGTDALYKFVVRCTFAEDGKPAFDDEDIPALKASSKARLAPLLKAVGRVNGWELEAEEKNSEAGPSSG